MDRGMVEVDPRARWAWPHLPATAAPGTWWIGPTGERVRVNEDGTADEAHEVPRRWSSSSDPCNALPVPAIPRCSRCGGILPPLPEIAAEVARAEAALDLEDLNQPRNVDEALDAFFYVSAFMPCIAGVCIAAGSPTEP
jgi:hypothetical protein